MSQRVLRSIVQSERNMATSVPKVFTHARYLVLHVTLCDSYGDMIFVECSDVTIIDQNHASRSCHTYVWFSGDLDILESSRRLRHVKRDHFDSASHHDPGGF